MSIDLKCRIRSSQAKRLHSCGSFDIKHWHLLNGGLALHWRLFPSNVSYATHIRTNRSNTNFGTTFKLGRHRNGPHLSCMNFVGLVLAIMIKWFITM